MPYSPSAAASSLVRPRQSHRPARLWWLRRRDGLDLRFTDHDHKLTFSDGYVYTPVGGFNPAAVRRQAALEPQNSELVGVLSSAAITFDDLRAGRYNEAEVNEYVCDSMIPWAGPLQHARYWLTKPRFNSEGLTFQVSGIPYWLRFNAGRVHTRECDNDLGDGNCRVDLAPLQFTSTVNVLVVDRKQFSVSSLTSSHDDYWAGGRIVWLDGPNVGIESEIRTYVDATRTVTLFLPTPFAIGGADSFTMTPGCDKTLPTCKDVFNNVVNRRASAFLPGTDKLIQTPTS